MVFSAVVMFSGCVEPFELPESAPDESLLVVDGYLNLEQGQATVKLTRTQNLQDEGAAPLETGAQVSLETEQGESQPLIAQHDGNYTASGLGVEYGKKYRLRIKTRNGREYLSAFVSSQKTPAIDSLTWNVEREGVQVRVNTHDPGNSTRYYLWEYEETYEYNASRLSQLVYDRGEVRYRREGEFIYTCWKGDASKNIYLGSTVQLAEDVIRDFPLAFNLGNSKKLNKKYSILVKQYGLSREEFNYWQLLKKNTENVGSLFDAQPSQVTGNITRVDSNPEETVFGYFSVRSMSTKRLFVTAGQLLGNGFRKEYQDCETTDISDSQVPMFLSSGYNLVLEELSPSGYSTAPVACADCRVQGGTNVKPDFWE